jgi:hypothetical protein
MTLNVPTGEELAAELETLAADGPGTLGDSTWCVKVTETSGAVRADSHWCVNVAETVGQRR